MDDFIVASAVFHILLISVGVGASLVAIVNYLYASVDGTLNRTERGMMGVTYIILRFITIAFLLSSLCIVLFDTHSIGIGVYSPALLANLTLLFVLYINAILISTQFIGIAQALVIQFSTWCTISSVTTLAILEVPFTVHEFVMLYIVLTSVIALMCSGGYLLLSQWRKQKRQ
jgi:hypothetical protein